MVAKELRPPRKLIPGRNDGLKVVSDIIIIIIQYNIDIYVNHFNYMSVIIVHDEIHIHGYSIDRKDLQGVTGTTAGSKDYNSIQYMNKV